jgi:hypothetical protein
MTTVPLSGTSIDLFTGVPMTSDYNNVMWFDNKTLQDNYFNSRSTVLSIDKANFQRIETSHILRINAHIDSLWNASYLRFKNASYGSRWFYAFVTQLEYVNQSVTLVHFQVDVMQTWMFDITFRQSFVAREHAKLWNSDGTPVINTLDEGLAYGSEYDVVKIDQIKPQNGLYFLVVATKRSVNVKNANGDYIINPNVNGVVQPLSYYLLPFTPDGNTPDVYIGGNKITLGSVQATLQELYKNDEAVNNIASLYITDHIGYDVAYDGTKCTLSSSNFASFPIGDSTVNVINVLALPSYTSTLKSLGDKYSGFKTVTESKLLMYPYTVITLSDSKGSSIDVKAEFIKNNNLEIRIRGSIGTSNKTAYMMDDYNYSSSQGLSTISSLENAIINNDPNDVPVITDMLSAYLQGNRNSLMTQKAQIQYNQQMNALKGSISTVTGAGQGAMEGASGGLAGSIAGGLAGGFMSGINTIQQSQNAQYQIASLMSKQEDVSNVPPSLSKLGSNIAFDFGNGVQGVYVIKRQIKQEYIDRLTDYFKMYGYKTNDVKVPNLHTRRSWNYVQTVDANITGNIPNQDIQQIKNIFDSGVTLWHVGATWCDYSQDNGVI